MVGKELRNNVLQVVPEAEQSFPAGRDWFSNADPALLMDVVTTDRGLEDAV